MKSGASERRGCKPDHRRIAEELRERGFAVIRNALPAATIAQLANDLRPHFARTPFGEGAFYGRRTKRFGRLLLRSSLAPALVQHELMTSVAADQLEPFCDCIQLNTTQAIEIHPGEPRQLPHRDDGMWPMPRGLMECLVNVMWPLTPFRRHNGGTLFWPKREAPLSPIDADPSSAVAPEVDPGDAILFLGSTLHSAGANRSLQPRAGIVIGYSLGWLRQHENQFLAYAPETARHFTPALRDLLGYRIHRPNLGCFEGRSPAEALQPVLPDHLAAKDEIIRSHAELLEIFAQRAGRELETA